MQPLYIDPIEAFWIGTNLAAALLTVLALRDAWQDRASVKRGNARSLAIIADGAVWQEALSLVIQVLLVLVVLPGIYVDRPIALSLPVVGLMLVPVALLAKTALAFWIRRWLNRVHERELIEARLATVRRPSGRA